MLSTLALHKSWIVFLGTFFLGESVVLTASALAAQGTWGWQAVAGWAFLGTVLSDAFWFRSAALGLGDWKSDEQKSRLARAAQRLESLTGDRPHRAPLFAKFLYGTRIASIAYMALKRVPTRTFVTFDAIGTLIWLGVMIPVGWAIGAGLDQAGARLKDIEWIILGVVLVAALVKGVLRWRRTQTV